MQSSKAASIERARLEQLAEFRRQLIEAGIIREPGSAEDAALLACGGTLRRPSGTGLRLDHHARVVAERDKSFRIARSAPSNFPLAEQAERGRAA